MGAKTTWMCIPLARPPFIETRTAQLKVHVIMLNHKKECHVSVRFTLAPVTFELVFGKMATRSLNNLSAINRDLYGRQALMQQPKQIEATQWDIPTIPLHHSHYFAHYSSAWH